MEINLSEYQPIPGFSTNYVISETGILLNLKRSRGKALTPFPTQRGYFSYRITDTAGKLRTVYRHRLMMLAWRYPKGDPYTLQVNHKNGIAGDDWLDNLEWCTAKENIEHAFATGIRKAKHPVETRDVLTGFVTWYPNAKVCGQANGLAKDGVYFRCRKGPTKVWPDYKQYRLASDEEWVIPTPTEIANVQANYGRTRAIMVWFVFTNKTLVFEGMTEAAKYLGIAVSTLSMRADRPGTPTFPEGYQLRYVGDNTPWHVPSDFYLDIEDKNPGTKLLAVVNNTTRNLWIVTLPEAAKISGAKKTTINMRLNSNSTNRTFGDFTIEYYREFIKVHSVSDYRLNVL